MRETIPQRGPYARQSLEAAVAGLTGKG